MRGMVSYLWWLISCHLTTVAFVLFALALIAGAYRLETFARTNHDVLCALESDIERRRNASVLYLEQHPRGVVSPVTNAVIISADELQRSIAAQTATLDALHRGGLHC